MRSSGADAPKHDVARQVAVGIDEMRVAGGTVERVSKTGAVGAARGEVGEVEVSASGSAAVGAARGEVGEVEVSASGSAAVGAAAPGEVGETGAVRAGAMGAVREVAATAAAGDEDVRDAGAVREVAATTTVGDVRAGEVREVVATTAAGDEEGRDVVARTPAIVPYATYALVALNVIVWVISVAKGADPVAPTPDWMLAHGGNAGAITLDGEPWRLGTSMFLHYGFLHLGLNMVGLVGGGRLVERLYGRVGFLVLYLVAGLAGGLASAMRPGVVSAGASGAIFGVLGALGAYYLLHRDRMEKEVAKEAAGLLVFLAYNALYGFKEPNVDMLAHVGGLGAGFVVGFTFEAGRRSRERTFVVSVIALGAVAVAILFVPPRADKAMDAAKAFDATEQQVITRWNELVEQAQRHELTDPQLADVIEKEILPPWRSAHQTFERDGGGEPKVRAKLLAYMEAREKGWETIVQGLRASDDTLIAQGMEKFKEAETLLKELQDKK